MRQSFSRMYLSVTGVVYLGLGSSLLTTLFSLPFVVVLVATDPAVTWPLLAAFALFSKILPWFAQANLHWIVLLLPIHLALAFALARPATVWCSTR